MNRQQTREKLFRDATAAVNDQTVRLHQGALRFTASRKTRRLIAREAAHVSWKAQHGQA